MKLVDIQWRAYNDRGELWCEAAIWLYKEKLIKRDDLIDAINGALNSDEEYKRASVFGLINEKTVSSMFSSVPLVFEREDVVRIIDVGLCDESELVRYKTLCSIESIFRQLLEWAPRLIDRAADMTSGSLLMREQIQALWWRRGFERYSRLCNEQT